MKQSQIVPALHDTLKPSMGAAMGRVHRLWRAAINQAVGDLGITEARWSVMLHLAKVCLLYTSPSPRDRTRSRMPSSA